MEHETKQSPLAVVIAFTLVLLSGQWTNIRGNYWFGFVIDTLAYVFDT